MKFLLQIGASKTFPIDGAAARYVFPLYSVIKLSDIQAKVFLIYVSYRHFVHGILFVAEIRGHNSI
jgi:hypothetical protein